MPSIRSVQLPASGLVVTLRAPTGVEELMLLEAPPVTTVAADLALATALAERLAEVADGSAPPDWDDVPVTDLDTLLLRLRQARVGHGVRGEVACPGIGCDQRVQISFSIDAFLDYVVHETKLLIHSDETGWFAVPRSDAALRFRLPTARDITAAAETPRPEQSLAVRCIYPPDATAAQRRRAERAMEALAPLGVRDLQGECPECGITVTAHFDIRRFCLRELRDLAVLLYDDVDLLARTYHWSEEAILALSADRRTRYAKRVRGTALAAA